MDPGTGRRIRGFVAEELLFEDPGRASVDGDTPLLASLDSFGLMRLVTFLEEELGVVIEDNDITAERFRTVADVERLVAEKTRPE